MCAKRTTQSVRARVPLLERLEMRALFSVSAPVTTILHNGASTNRIDLSVVGDGYTSSQMSLFHSNVQTFVSGFFNEAPLSSYKSFFNVYAVDVTSSVSGVSDDNSSMTVRNTPLSMTYWTNGIERLLGVDTSAAKSYASLAPGDDQTIAIANDTKYGGAGYPTEDVLTFAGGNSQAIEIVKHEFGHSFGDLADEYDYGGPAAYTGSEPTQADVSTYTSAEMIAKKVKWYRWIGVDGVGTYEGADYSQIGIYRPTQDSKMRTLGVSYGPVDTEQLIEKMYQTVHPIDAATAAGSYGSTANFFVSPLQPSSHPDSVQWYLDGKIITGATSTTFSASTLKMTAGNHSLMVKVQDTTNAVRDEDFRAKYMTETKSWTVTVAAPPALAMISGQVFNDTLGGGARTADSTGIGSVRLFIDTNQNGVLDVGEPSLRTDDTGHYSFRNLTGGTYRVREIIPTGYRSSNTTTGYFDLKVSAGTTGTQDFALTHKTLISGSIFAASSTGQALTGTSLAGWRVFVDWNNDGKFESTENSKLTDQWGHFTFQSIDAGTYTLRAVRPDGYVQTLPTNNGGVLMTNVAGQIKSNVNFSFKKIV